MKRIPDTEIIIQTTDGKVITASSINWYKRLVTLIGWEGNQGYGEEYWQLR